MVALKVETLLVFLLLLASNTPAQLVESEWEKLVCTLFTGAKLSGGNGRLLFDGPILDILASCSNDHYIVNNMKNVANYRYFPSLTASFGVNQGGDIDEVYFSGRGVHAERKLIAHNYSPGELQIIVISYSPCLQCVNMIIDQYQKWPQILRPLIQFSWVFGHPKHSTGLEGICRLKEHGFKLEVCEIDELIDFLLEQSPTSVMHDKLLEAVDSSSEALLERDTTTLSLINQPACHVDIERPTHMHRVQPQRFNRNTDKIKKFEKQEEEMEEEEVYEEEEVVTIEEELATEEVFWTEWTDCLFSCILNLCNMLTHLLASFHF